MVDYIKTQPYSVAPATMKRMAPTCMCHHEETALILHSTVIDSHFMLGTQRQQIILRSCYPWAFSSLSPLPGRLCSIFAWRTLLGHPNLSLHVTFSERPPNLKGPSLRNAVLVICTAQYFLFACLLSASLTVSFMRAGISSVLFIAIFLELKTMPVREKMLKKHLSNEQKKTR